MRRAPRRSRRRLAAFALLLCAGCGGERRDAAPPGSVEVAALVDHHVHVFNVGWWLRQQARPTDELHASGARSEAEVVGRVDSAARAGTGGWIVGSGWNQESWEDRTLPGLDPLSAAVRDRPVALARTDGHTLWVNRAALLAAGIRGARGVLLERDVEPVIAMLAPPSDEAIVDAWRRGADAMAARGVTRVYDAGVLAVPGVVALNADFARFARLLARTDSARPLPVRIHLMIPAPSAFAESVLVMPVAARQLSPNVVVTHLKLFTDGALGNRAAALSHPYADDPHTQGVLRMDAAAIASWTRRALDAGLDVATHAIGDRAVHEALDAYEAVLRERPGLVPARLRIEHFSYASEADLVRAVRLGIALSIQSNFNLPRGAPAPGFAERRVGRANAVRVYAWDRLDSMGALLIEGTDHFAAPSEPLAGVHAALTGANALGERGDTRALRERLLRMHQAWLAPGGRLLEPTREGQRVRLSGDPLTLPLDSLRAVTVLRAP